MTTTDSTSPSTWVSLHDAESRAYMSDARNTSGGGRDPSKAHTRVCQNNGAS